LPKPSINKQLQNTSFLLLDIYHRLLFVSSCRDAAFQKTNSTVHVFRHVDDRLEFYACIPVCVRSPAASGMQCDVVLLKSRALFGYVVRSVHHAVCAVR